MSVAAARPGIREIMAHTLSHGDLTNDPNRETGCDRVAALAWSDALGSALWHIALNHDVSSWKQARAVLAKRLRGDRAEAGIYTAIAEIALREWMDDKCSVCRGRKFVMNEEVKTACIACEATGRRRHSDTERRLLLGVEERVYRRFESLFAAAHSAISNADALCEQQVLRNLGRRRPRGKRSGRRKA